MATLDNTIEQFTTDENNELLALLALLDLSGFSVVDMVSYVIEN